MVSVIIPVYNVKKYLSECFQSVTKQTYENLEIIVIDDGSTDGSSDLCDKFAESDNRVTVIHQKNKGVSAARNVGLDNARGEFIVFLDSDDVIKADAIETLMSIQNKSDADIVIGMYTMINDDGSPRKDSNEKLIEGELTEKQFWEYAGKKYISIVIPVAKIYKKSIWDNLRYPEGLINEDQYILPDLVAKSNKIVGTNKVIYEYRNNESSIMRKKFSFERLDTIEAYIRILECIRKKGVADAEREYAHLGMRMLAKAKNCLKMTKEEKEIFNDRYYRFKRVIKHIDFYRVKEHIQIFCFCYCFPAYSILHSLRDKNEPLL